MAIDPSKTYTADISTTYGDIKVALDAKDATKGVNNFVHLARERFYDGLTWHRLVKGFVIQGGDPKGDGTGGPGYQVVTELPKNGYPLGTLAWAKTSDAPAGSAGSQFFIVTANRPASLEAKQNGSYQYGAFGHVASGMPVVQKIESFAPNTPNGGAPAHPIYIKKVTITVT
jgi:cyclophilin family peptidyl-prolyl cis-trans isomerase